MKSNPLISVIIPIYDVERYLKRNVESIINQTYRNLEIILVDDGSPDNCPKICDEYKKKDSRIKVIHKKNGGLSDARNAGLEIATGEYISFIDSDDWIDLETYSIAIEKMLETNAEICAFNILWVYENKNAKPDLSDEFEILNSEQAIEMTMDNKKVRTTAWNKIYKTDIIGSLRFPKGKLNEDEFFTFRALDRANNILYLHRQFYYYFQRNNSIMGSYNINRLDMVDGVMERMSLISEKYPNLYNRAKISLCEVCLYHYQLLLKNKDIDKDNKGKEKLINYRKRVKLKISDLNKLSTVNKISLFLTNSSFGFHIIAIIRNLIGLGV